MTETQLRPSREQRGPSEISPNGIILILFALKPVCSHYLLRLYLSRLCFTNFVPTIKVEAPTPWHCGVLFQMTVLPFALAALTYGVAYGYDINYGTDLPEISPPGLPRRAATAHQRRGQSRQDTDNDFLRQPNAASATYRLAPQRARYQMVIKPAGKRPIVSNPTPADEVWQEVDKPVDEDAHTFRGGVLAGVMKVVDDDDVVDDQAVELDEDVDQNLRTIDLPEGLCVYLIFLECCVLTS